MTDNNTEKYPINIQKLFTPKPPLIHIPPNDYAPEKRKSHTITSITSLKNKIDKYITEELPQIEKSQKLEQDQLHSKRKKPNTITLEELKKLSAKKQRVKQESIHRQLQEWDDPSALAYHEQQHQMRDPFRTVFVSRIDYKLTENDLNKEFKKYGPIESIRVVRDNVTEKSKGYAFVVFDRDVDASRCVEELARTGLKLDSTNRTMLVDIERGRIVRNWKPRRLGGGLGGRHYTQINALSRLNPNASAAASGRRLNIQNGHDSIPPSSLSSVPSHPRSQHSGSSYIPRNGNGNINSNSSVSRPSVNSYSSSSVSSVNKSSYQSSNHHRPIQSYNSTVTTPPTTTTITTPSATTTTGVSAAPLASKYGGYGPPMRKSTQPSQTPADQIKQESASVKDRYAKYATASSSTTTTTTTTTTAYKPRDNRSIRSIRRG
ncbi:uncharacterized protein RJT21DRAFT_25327 [Scheffersomyces amazonensis]|uniref:uncharacterized protein n=1 Tax=Scheffersomyces amazonensis TaxID=1078765 RepID=UPI00315DC1F4